MTSKLVEYTRISPNRNSPRKGVVKKITIHHMAGNMSLESFGAMVSRISRGMSSNYAIDSKGRVGLFCPEEDRSWCSSSPENDHQAITIEVANDSGAPAWTVSAEAYDALIDLCFDICERYKIYPLTYDGTPNGSLTIHKMFAKTECPGPYLMSKLFDICRKVNDRLEKIIHGQPSTIEAGAAIDLSNTPLYVASTAEKPVKNLTGRYYAWDGEAIAGRIRITNSPDLVGVAGQVTGWIDLPKTDTGDVDAPLQILTIGPVSNGDAMQFWNLAKKLNVEYSSKYDL